MGYGNTLHPVHAVYDGLFNTASHKKMNIIEPTADMFTLNDIATGLSNICRFGGQLPRFYSVAQHSILVCELAPPELKREALMHDATEAYLGDMIKPLKVIVGDAYTDVEQRFTIVISDKYNLDAGKLLAIKQFDKQALEIEHEYFFLKSKKKWDAAFQQNNRVWSNRTAKHLFIKYFHELFPGIDSSK